MQLEEQTKETNKNRLLFARETVTVLISWTRDFYTVGQPLALVTMFYAMNRPNAAAFSWLMS